MKKKNADRISLPKNLPPDVVDAIKGRIPKFEPPVVDPEILATQSDRLSEIVAKIGIIGLLSRVDIDTTGKVPTACWAFNPKNKTFKIKVGYELIQILDDEELRLVLEHELLHHVRYRACDIRNALMSNIVLDVAINKTLYLYKKDVIVRLFEKLNKIGQAKTGKSFEDVIADGDPGILVYPTLDAEQIEKIGNEKVKDAYIEIWGNRQTPMDFNTEVPSPLTLYYKLVEFINVDVSSSNPFGEDEDESEGAEGDGESEGESSEKKDTEKKNKGGKGKGKGKRQRIKIDEDTTSGGADGKPEEEKPKDDVGQGSASAEKNKEEEQSPGNSPNGNDGEDGDNGRENIDSYADVLEGAEKLAQEAETGAGGQAWGNTGGVISLRNHRPPEINTEALREILERRVFEQTVDEIGCVVSETLGTQVTRQVFPVRPTRATLTYMACGITELLPIYYNKKQGEAKPKLMSYIDVSGAMGGHMPLVTAIMVRIAEFLPSVCYLFDTEIMPFPTQAWHEVCADGGGTNFDVVIEHILSNPTDRMQWFEKWMKKYYKPRDTENWDSSSAVAMVNRHGLDAFVANEDYPAILWITDGECSISHKNVERFKATGKKLIVLFMVDNYCNDNLSMHENNVFKDIFHAIYFINSRGEIVYRQGI